MGKGSGKQVTLWPPPGAESQNGNTPRGVPALGMTRQTCSRKH